MTFYTTVTVYLRNGDGKGKKEIEWELVEEKGLYVDGIKPAIESTKKRLASTGPEVMAIILIPSDGIRNNLAIVKPEYAHRIVADKNILIDSPKA